MLLEKTKPHDYSRPFEVERLKVIDRCVERIAAEGGSLIEFGCNAGEMTEQFAGAFESVVAIDYDAGLVRQAAERVGTAGVECVQLDLNCDLPERLWGRFDAAVALEVIEHLESPERFVRQIRRCLKSGGRLLISAPNTRSPEAVMGRFLGARDGIAYTAWDDSHVSLFDVGSFLGLLRRNGFEVTRLTGYYYGFVLPKIRANVRLHWSTSVWPVNRLGFDSIVEARTK